MCRAFGDWTRRQSAAVTAHCQPPTIDPRISERQQLLERILQTTRWPTKHNVADVDPDNNAHHFTPIHQPPLPILAKDQETPPQQPVWLAEKPKIEVNDEAVTKRNLMFPLASIILGQGNG